MPPNGWKQIQVHDDVYDYFRKKYEEMKDEYRVRYGITSFNGFVAKALNEMIERYEEKERAEKPQAEAREKVKRR
jgi:hypothetical protein